MVVMVEVEEMMEVILGVAEAVEEEVDAEFVRTRSCAVIVEVRGSVSSGVIGEIAEVVGEVGEKEVRAGVRGEEVSIEGTLRRG